MGRRAVAGTCVVVAALAACSNDTTADDEASAPTATLPATTHSVGPGLTTTLILSPASLQGPSPLVVLVPGGSFVSADPTGMVPLAESLARDGATAATTTYRTAAQDAFFPTPVQDVACGVAFAVAEATRRGRPPSEVVVLGHSAGATLAALVALDPDEFTDEQGCPSPAAFPDRLIGLAGLSAVTDVPDVAANLFGPGLPDPADWAPGDPMALADERPDLPVLLVHGAADPLVPRQLTEQFAAALESAGHEVATEYPEGVDHDSVYNAQVAGPLVSAWLGLPGTAPTQQR